MKMNKKSLFANHWTYSDSTNKYCVKYAHLGFKYYRSQIKESTLRPIIISNLHYTRLILFGCHEWAVPNSAALRQGHIKVAAVMSR